MSKADKLHEQLRRLRVKRARLDGVISRTQHQLKQIESPSHRSTLHRWRMRV